LLRYYSGVLRHKLIVYSCLVKDTTAITETDESLPLAKRKPRRTNRQMPKRFRDIMPQPLPLALPERPESPSPSVSPRSVSSPNPSEFSSRVHQVFRTPRNIFGLFRQYCSEQPPSHDPEEYADLEGVSDDPPIATLASLQSASSSPLIDSLFYPYPNKSSFQLGEWYWNGGIQKSRESFCRLVSIVGDPQFCTEDVRCTDWRLVDTKLAVNDFDQPMDDGTGWMDEDAGWKRTPVSISVPFHRRARQPGPQNFLVGDFYHRSLVSVIREKLANVQDMKQFHLEPFELFWRPSSKVPDVRVHGELYTSVAFVEAHRELQNAPREPDCDLPRVVVALMFWSDAMELTSYGTAHLWPAYLYFGNESKYRRCKPSNHLCNHVAYFQAVGPCSFVHFIIS